MATPRNRSLNLLYQNLLTTHISLLSLSSACQIVHHLHVQLKTIRPVPSPVCESQNLISRRSWKGVSCWAPFTAALFGAQVWAHNFLSPLQAEQSSWWRTENPPPRFFALRRFKNPFHLLFIPPPQLHSHELSLHYAETLRCWCFTESSSCDVSCSSIAQQISTKTPGCFSTVGWKFHRLAEIAALALPLVLKMI